MLSEIEISSSGGSLSSGIEIDGSIKAVVTFIREHFKSFAKKYNSELEQNEKLITQQLCIYLNRKAKQQPFFFHSEFAEKVTSGNSPQVDIGVLSQLEEITISDKTYGEDECFFSIEAKRLPTPGANREKEYVVGHNSSSGGIERFKKSIHGPNLSHAAIIGYVQKETFNYWFLEVNNWINELAANKNGIWETADCLQKVDGSDSIYIELLSENSREARTGSRDKIKLFHFWINLIPTQ